MCWMKEAKRSGGVSLPRLRLETCTLLSEKEWLIDSDQQHHLTRVLRCKEGDRVEGLFLGEKIVLALCFHPDGLAVRECYRLPLRRDHLEIHLLLGLLKADQFDIALRASAELGVAVIHLLACARSVPQLGEDKIRGKMQRWSKILHEATRQCGSVTPPMISPPVPLRDFDFASLPGARFAALLAERSIPIGNICFENKLAFAVGPEGDWDLEEEALLMGNQFKPVGLGDHVLRSSTAVVAGCSWFRLKDQAEKI